MLLDQKIAVITGGASGQGLASARAFLREGAVVHALDRDARGGQGGHPGLERRNRGRGAA